MRDTVLPLKRERKGPIDDKLTDSDEYVVQRLFLKSREWRKKMLVGKRTDRRGELTYERKLHKTIGIVDVTTDRVPSMRYFLRIFISVT